MPLIYPLCPFLSVSEGRGADTLAFFPLLTQRPSSQVLRTSPVKGSRKFGQLSDRDRR